MVDAKKYVVLDVETNGLSSIRDDLLSISIYRPDNKSVYNRFLPLEKNDEVETTHINGITKDTLKDAAPLTQTEVDDLVRDFELDMRIILTYGSLDYKFLVRYFNTHKLNGINEWQFLNFKHNIISSRFEHADLSKDNLCKFFGIRGIKRVHSGINDCKLEWKLFEKLDNQIYLILHSRIYGFTDEYIVPASYLSSYYNFRYHKRIPNLKLEKELVKKIEMPKDLIKKYQTNFNGLIIENVVYSLINAEEQDNTEFLLNNKTQLRYVGCLIKNFDHEIEVYFNRDGTINVFNEAHKELESELNEYITELKGGISKLTDYLKERILGDEKILSQEMVVNTEDKVLALCDLSTEKSVVELKTYMSDDWDEYKIQLYYQSRGRDIYIVTTNWDRLEKHNQIVFEIYKVTITELDKGEIKKSTFDSRQKEAKEKAQKDFDKNNLDLVEFFGNNIEGTLQCRTCGHQFKRVIRYTRDNLRAKCPYCRIKSFDTVKPIRKPINKSLEKLIEKPPKKHKNLPTKSMSIDEKYEKKLVKWVKMKEQKDRKNSK